MKDIRRNYYLRRAFGIGFGLIFLTGISPMYAQDIEDGDEAEEEVTEQVAKKRPLPAGPTYQMKEISGQIFDAATRKPLSGVQVQALNDIRYTAMTEEDGRYKISVPVFVTALYVAAPEYNPVQVAIKDGPINVNLYSSVFKSFFKNGTDVFKSQTAETDNSSALTVEQDIESQLNGTVRTMTRGGLPAQGAAMFINGFNSLNATAQPLVVVDGVIWDMQYDRTAIHAGFINNVFASLDPEDVESVRVLDTGTALYGAKGANGVIEITTKRGRNRATRIGVRIYGGVETTPKTLDVMSGNQYRSYLTEILGTYVPTNPSDRLTYLQLISSRPFMNEDPNYTFYDIYHNNENWQKELYHTAITQNYRVNVQGGDDIAMYALSLGYTGSDATAKDNDFNRLNIRFNTDINMTDRLSAAFDISYARSAYNMRDNGWAEDYSKSNIASPNVLGLINAPMISKYAYYVYWDEAQQRNLLTPASNIYAGKNYSDSNNPFRFGEDFGTAALANPYWILENGQGDNKNYEEQTQFTLNFNPKYQLNSWLTIGDRFSYVMNRTSELYYMPNNGTPQKFVDGLGSVTSAVRSQFADESAIANNFYLHADKHMGEHTLSATAGFRFNTFNFSNSYTNGYNNSNDKMPNLSYSLQYLTYGGTNDTWTNLAYYLDAHYNYLNRYFLDATVTAESSSRFGKNTKEGVKLFGVKWATFPSVRAAWLISSEPWFNFKPVNYLKLSAGYEESGNDNIDYYASRTYFSNEKFLNTSTSLSLANIANSEIQWETTRRLNAGLETSLLDNRLNLGVNFFWSKTSNLLTLQNLNYLTGLPAMWSNNGALKNTGASVNVSGIVVNSKNFTWELGFSVGHYKNEITELPDNNLMKLYNLNEDGSKGDIYKKVRGYTSSIYGTNNILTSIGNAAGVFYGYQTKGVFVDETEASTAGKFGYLRYPTGYVGDSYRNFKAGDVHFVDQNGDGWISEADMVKIGDPNPDVYGNIFTSFGFLKNFKLDVIFKYSLGNDIYNYQASQLEQSSNLWNQTTAVLNRWTHSGQVTDMPRAMLTSSTEWVNNERFSDRWIEDGSFLKLKKVRLTYKLPLSLSWLQGFTVWGEANNLFTITKYRGLDPEVSCGNGVLYQGIDSGMLPQSRSFNFGVTINL